MVNNRGASLSCATRAAQAATLEIELRLDVLSDAELLDREAADRLEFLRLSRGQPRPRATTYLEIRTSPVQLEAWARWTASGAAARSRGLAPRRRDRTGAHDRSENR